MPAFTTVLVANRGEIAVRILRSLRENNYRSVAVYSDADRDALHVQQADCSVLIGGSAARDSYLNIERIIEAAKRSGVEAIHPGYGFLSENADFARRCAEEDIVFIGPPADAIALMGSKRLAKQAMLAAGVPCIPGYEGADQSDAALLQAAQGIGFPLMIKASAGGGGRGMRRVNSERELQEQLHSARSEALNAFGSNELILEKAIDSARHVEIQVFADQHGNVIHLGERDCSVQRRHQKVIEEAPSPAVDNQLREAMGAAAVQAASACDYRGAGTVEFLLGADGQFYFLEMNTRLQVEHPVTELITGQDLVAWQLRVAAGEPLPLRQQDVRLNGHAIEVRLYAEDPHRDFLPQTGTVYHWVSPQGPGIRLDHCLRDGLPIGSHYDPMLAKLIAWGESRQQALQRLRRALEELTVLGVTTNQHYLGQILSHPVFARGEATTNWLQSQPISAESAPETRLSLAAIVFHARAARSGDYPASLSHWSNALDQQHHYRLAAADGEEPVDISVRADQSGVYNLRYAEQCTECQLTSLSEHLLTYIENGVSTELRYALDGDTLFLQAEGTQLRINNLTYATQQSQDADGQREISAAMDGVIVDVLVSEGDSVSKGQTLIVLEAMKMEHPLKAGIDGTVSSIHIDNGQQVKSRQLLATLRANCEQTSAESLAEANSR